MTDDLGERLRENVTGIVALVVTGSWLAALASGQGWWLPFLLFGYIVLVPIVAILSGDQTGIDEWWGDDDEDQLERGERRRFNRRTRALAVALRPRERPLSVRPPGRASRDPSRR